MPWKCQSCRELVDDALAVCWHCGTSCDGSPDPDFQHADDLEPDSPPLKPQYNLGTLAALMFAGGLIFALFGSIVHGGPTVLTVVAGVAAIGLVALQVFSWLLVRRVNRLQHTIRDSVREIKAEKRRHKFRF